MTNEPTKSASKESLEELHAALARSLTSRINSGEATAADLNVIRQFLKDNGIDSIPKKGSPLGDLVNTLPFASPEAIAAENEIKLH